ncbi:hypothetical protein D3C72_1548000 [compost metagenome]
MEGVDGQVQVQFGGQLAALQGQAQVLADLDQAFLVGLALALEDGAVVLHHLALVEDDLEDPAPARVDHGLAHHVGADIADAAQRIFLARQPLGIAQRFHGQVDAVAHGGKHVALVLEVPVDRAAGDTRRLGDVGQRRACHAAGVEHGFGRVENPLARLQRLFLGASDHLSL